MKHSLRSILIRADDGDRPGSRAARAAAAGLFRRRSPTVIGGRTVEPPQPPFTPSPPPAPAKGGQQQDDHHRRRRVAGVCCCCASDCPASRLLRDPEQIESISSLLMPFLPLDIAARRQNPSPGSGFRFFHFAACCALCYNPCAWNPGPKSARSS